MKLVIMALTEAAYEGYLPSELERFLYERLVYGSCFTLISMNLKELFPTLLCEWSGSSIYTHELLNYNQSLDLDTLSCVNTYIDRRVVIRFLWNLARHIGIDTVVQMLKVSIELEEINQ